MSDASNENHDVAGAYRRRARSYDRAVRLFDVFGWLGFNIAGWRRRAVSELGLEPGDTVVDIGCGTGLNFPTLHRAVGPHGTIIGVDLSEEMLAQAAETVAANQWDNVELVCADAHEYEFPSGLDAVVTTYALILIPDPDRIVRRAADALGAGGRLVVLDMAWPRFVPLWWRHILFFLRSYGVTADVLRRRPWEAVRGAMDDSLSIDARRTYWFGFFYSISGVRRPE